MEEKSTFKEVSQSKVIRVSDFIGTTMEDDFLNFDLTEIQVVLAELANGDVSDIARVERLQQLSLRGADVITEFLGRIVKTNSYLESRVTSVKNKAALEYKKDDGSKVTADLRKLASEADPEVEKLQMALAKAKGTKVLLEKKYDILIKAHHFYKDIGNGLKKIMPLGDGNNGWNT